MKLQRLGDVVKNLDSKRIPLNSEERIAKSNQGLYPYIGANNIVGFIDEYIFDEKILCVAEDGGSWGANQQCAVIYEGKTWVNNHAHVLVENGKANLEYLKNYLNYTNLNKYIKGATRGKLNKSILENILIPLPQLPDQLHIANLLSKAENLIAQRKESIRLLDEFLKSTFLEMFGDPVRNEKGWEVCNLSELGSLDRGVSKARPRNSPELLGGIYPLIQTGDVTNAGIYITAYKQTYSELGLKQSKLWPKGTMLITIAANIAQTSILSFDACFPDSVVGFVTNTKNARVLYVHFLFKFFQALLESKASQTAQKNINLDILRNLKVPCPPLKLQTQFAQIVEKTEALKAQYQQSLQELENLYGSLSQKAFKGELSLKVAGLLMAAEPKSSYVAQSNVPDNKRGFAKQVLGGKIVSLFKDDNNFTRIKFQKLQYLAEQIAEENLLWNYYRQAAGPHDNKFKYSVIAKLNENKWFEERSYKFYPLQKASDVDRYYQKFFGNKSDRLNEFFLLLKNATEKFCEAIATIYAVWNNHIILQLPYNKSNIKKDFFEWSNRKEIIFTEDEFEKALEWMKKHNIEPIGFGQLIKEGSGKK